MVRSELHRRKGGRFLASALALVTCLTSVAALAESPKPRTNTPASRPAQASAKVSVAGLQICTLTDEGQYEHWRLSDFKPSASTKLLVQICPDDGQLIDLDKDASQMQSMEDNTGKDLKPKSFDEMFFFFQVATGGKSALIEFDSTDVPSSQANSLRARASLTFLVGSKKEKTKTPTVAVKKGTKLDVNGTVLTISNVGKTMGGKPSITLSGKKEPAAIASIVVIDASGKPLKTSEASHSRSSTPFSSSWTREIELDRLVEEASFQIEYWTDLKTINVPVDVKCTVQLQATQAK